jgi:hypothetical protein
MNKKNYIILGILLCIIVAASGCTQNIGNNSTPTIAPQNISPNDVIASVSYSGSWKGFIIDKVGYRNISGTGNQAIDLGNFTGFVSVTAIKTDNGTGNLTVSINKAGTTVASKSSSAQHGVAITIARV